MSIQETSEESIPNPFICDCEEDRRQACASEGFYKEKEGKRYCVLHYPGDEKVADFQTALNGKLAVKDYNFKGVWFPKGAKFKEPHWDGNADFSFVSFNEDIDFSGVEFHIKALFNHASFNAGVAFRKVIFSEGADFSFARFSATADFSSASFSDAASFTFARFSDTASFINASFSNAYFISASFSDAYFISASFSAVADFRKASFSAAAYFISVSFSAAAYFIFASFSAAAYFGFAKFSAAAYFGFAKFSAAASFICASFSAASFRSAGFSAAADFRSAGFNAAADFNSAGFSAAAHFFSARFSAAADFSSAGFGAVADFSSASFSAVADFSSASFSAVGYFRQAIFKDYFYFTGEPQKRTCDDQQQLNFQFARFEKPDRVSFHTLDLKPHWFANVDSRKFEFTDVEFNYKLRAEMESLKKAEVGAPHRLLSIACRQLADNAEANHRYREASRLRYSSFEARRIERFYGLSFWRLDWWYWLASGYGESVLRAFIIFVVLIGLCAIGYKKADFDPTSKTAITKPMPSAASSSPGISDIQPRRLGWRESVLYSFNVSILQKPDPKPIGLWGNALVSLETVLGPAQAALLALALRRRFMR